MKAVTFLITIALMTAVLFTHADPANKGPVCGMDMRIEKIYVVDLKATDVTELAQFSLEAIAMAEVEKTAIQVEHMVAEASANITAERLWSRGIKRPDRYQRKIIYRQPLINKARGPPKIG